MKLLWTVKLYSTGGLRLPYRVHVQGYADGDYGGRVHSNTGKGKTPDEALQAACALMAVKPWLAR